MRKILTLTLAILLSCTVLFAGCGETPDAPPEGPDIQQPGDKEPDDKEPDDKEPTEPETIEGLEIVSDEEMNTFQTDALRLFGRTYFQKKQLCFDNGATGFEAVFYGTRFEAELVPMTTYLYYRVFIDGEEEGTKKPLSGNRSYILARNLEEGVHTVRFVKSISSQNGVVQLAKLRTDGKFLRPEKKDRLRIEFVGDSITVGAGLYGKAGEACTVKNSDAAKSYAYLTAQALDADFSFVATEGICVKKKIGWLTVNMMEMYRQLSSVTTGEYVYPEKTHDVVVVALGTNDGFAMNSDSKYTQELFTADYLELLELIRSKNPNAKIVCVYGMMTLNNAIEKGIQAAIAQKGDDTISYLRLPTDNNGADSHPSLEGAKRQSETLLEYLNGIL